MSSRGRSKLRRVLTRAVFFLLAGAIINVLVAWACAAWMPLSPGKGRLVVPRGDWPRPATKSWGECSAIISERGPGYAQFTALGYLAVNGRDMAEQYFVEAGLPLRGMEFIRQRAHQSSGRGGSLWTLPPQTTAEGIVIPKWLRPRQFRWYPTMVMPLAFTANTCMYAAVIAGIWLGIPRMLARRRRAAKLCPKCRYSLVGLVPDPTGLLRCPECGEVAR